MFTGIVREIGRVEALESGEGGARLRVRAPTAARAMRPGDSLAVAGVCLTAAETDGAVLSFDLVPETLARTSLGLLRAEAEVNLEPPLRAGDPLGGHLVQGHVDAVGTVRALEPLHEGALLSVALAPEALRYCVEKGSVAVDGVSLTVAALDDASFSVALVPHTLAATTLGRLRRGDPVNVEVDVVAKYVERLLEGRRA